MLINFKGKIKYLDILFFHGATTQQKAPELDREPESIAEIINFPELLISHHHKWIIFSQILDRMINSIYFRFLQTNKRYFFRLLPRQMKKTRQASQSRQLWQNNIPTKSDAFLT